MIDPPSLKEHIRILEERLLQPEVRKSAEKLAALLADDFLELGCSGRTYDKRQAIAILMNSPVADADFGDFRVRLLASDIVLAAYTLVQPGKPGAEKKYSLRSSIWRWQEGKWQIVFHQGTPFQHQDFYN